jgi:hypothetical protein
MWKWPGIKGFTGDLGIQNSLCIGLLRGAHDERLFWRVHGGTGEQDKGK